MKRRHKKSPVCAFLGTLGTLLLIVVIVLCLPFTVPKIFGYQMYTVVSGSMEPALPIGSLVYIGASEAKDAETGDIVAFYGGRDANTIITHRVVENRVVMGELITKGDANQTEDMNPVAYEQFIGRVTLAIPKAGVIAQMLTSFQGKVSAACMIGLAVILHILSDVLEKK